MATENFTIKPSDGWVAITDADVAFIRVRSYPDRYTFYITSSATPPTSDDLGYRVDCKDFWVNVPATGELYYVRAVNPAPDAELRIDVFSIAGA